MKESDVDAAISGFVARMTAARTNEEVDQETVRALVAEMVAYVTELRTAAASTTEDTLAGENLTVYAAELERVASDFAEEFDIPMPETAEGSGQPRLGFAPGAHTSLGAILDTLGVGEDDFVVLIVYPLPSGTPIRAPTGTLTDPTTGVRSPTARPRPLPHGEVRGRVANNKIYQYIRRLIINCFPKSVMLYYLLRQILLRQ